MNEGGTSDIFVDVGSYLDGQVRRECMRLGISGVLALYKLTHFSAGKGSI